MTGVKILAGLLVFGLTFSTPATAWAAEGGWNGWKNSLRNMETLFGFIVRFW